MTIKPTLVLTPLTATTLLLLSPTVVSSETVNLESLQEQIQEQKQILENQRQQLDKLIKQQSTSNTVDKKNRLRWEGYAIANYQRFEYYENIQDSKAENRASTDLERVVLEPHFDMGNGYEFVAEIEFEHGGTGSTVEFEPEEAGEFESEIEKGGEVVLEKAELRIKHSPAFNIRVGEMLVPFGMLNSHHKPTQYYTTQRSLAEDSLIPAIWHETGVGIYGQLGKVKYQTQIITALDSSGFSGFNFVKGGMQSKLEVDNADDLAFFGRIDYQPVSNALLGASVYTGDSSGNRPRKNLDASANVTLFEIHGRYDLGPLSMRAEYLQGTVENSDLITQANLTTFNGDVLGISNTSVGHQAESWFIEAGLNISHFIPSFGNKVIPFARYESYDTHADTEGNIVKVDRYEREATTVGINYYPRKDIVFKGEYSYRENAGSTANEQDVFGLGVGFQF